MKEILFRGKRVDNGEWVYGFYNHIPCGRFKENEHLIQTIKKSGKIGNLYGVIPETVGQFTGLCDKKGTKIFEGDILTDGNAKYLAEYSLYSCGFQADGFDREGIWSLYHLCHGNNRGKEIEVIGNIHDNPDLLKG